MIQAAEEAVRQERMLCPGDRVLVALSGGADSTALLLLLGELRRAYSLELCAVHINHGLRGDEAERDEAFAGALCAEQSVELKVYHTPVRQLARERGQSLELCGREERYRLFEQAAAEWHATKIATAHTASDNGETILWNLIRGTGLTGLCGIPPVRGRYIRPLIRCTRQEIEDYLRGRNQPFVTDSTNLSDEFTRNRLRHQLIPLLEREFNPALLRSLGRTAENLRELYDYCEEREAALEKACRTERGYALGALSQLAPAERSLLLRGACRRETGHMPEQCHTRALLQLAGAGKNGSVSLPGGYRARVSNQNLFFEKNEKPAEFFERILHLGENYFDGMKITVEGPYDTPPKINTLFNTALFDYDKIASAIVARQRRPGDVLHLPGGHSRTLKRLMIDRKVDRWLRARLPVLECGGEILWVPQVAADVRFQPDGQTRRFLQITVRFETV